MLPLTVQFAYSTFLITISTSLCLIMTAIILISLFIFGSIHTSAKSSVSIIIYLSELINILLIKKQFSHINLGTLLLLCLLKALIMYDNL